MNKALAYLVAALALAFAVAPAVTSPFSGFEADQLPIPQINPPIQPAGYAFAIWGLIYVWLVISAIFGALRRAEDGDWDKARWPLALSLAVGVPWLAIANESAIWATITIIIMAFGAIASLILAPVRDRWVFQAPVGIYAGWLTAASAVSIGTTLAGYGVLFEAFGWAVTGILLALVAATVVYAQRPSATEYLLTVVWALVGVVAANGLTLPIVSGLAVAGILALLVQIWLRRAALA